MTELTRPIELTAIRAARERIAGTAIRTPLVRLELGSGFPDIRLKLENLQPINAYKLRGAVNAVAMLSDEERKLGVWTISAGNAGQGVAYAARKAGVPFIDAPHIVHRDATMELWMAFFRDPDSNVLAIRMVKQLPK